MNTQDVKESGTLMELATDLDAAGSQAKSVARAALLDVAAANELTQRERARPPGMEETFSKGQRERRRPPRDQGAEVVSGDPLLFRRLCRSEVAPYPSVGDAATELVAAHGAPGGEWNPYHLNVNDAQSLGALEESPELYVQALDEAEEEARRTGKKRTTKLLQAAVKRRTDYLSARESLGVPDLTYDESRTFSRLGVGRQVNPDLVEEARTKAEAESRPLADCLAEVCQSHHAFPVDQHLLAVARGSELEALVQPLAASGRSGTNWRSCRRSGGRWQTNWAISRSSSLPPSLPRHKHPRRPGSRPGLRMPPPQAAGKKRSPTRSPKQKRAGIGFESRAISSSSWRALSSSCHPDTKSTRSRTSWNPSRNPSGRAWKSWSSPRSRSSRPCRKTRVRKRSKTTTRTKTPRLDEQPAPGMPPWTRRSGRHPALSDLLVVPSLWRLTDITGYILPISGAVRRHATCELSMIGSEKTRRRSEMANNYVQFSEVLPHLTADEETWLRQQLEYVYVFGDEEYAADELPDGLNPDDADWQGFRGSRQLDDCDPAMLEFEYEFCAGDEWNDWGRHLWFYAEEAGEPAQVAHLVQMFLRRFRASECWSLTYALTCSKPRVGEFSGGACFVTADEIRWQDGYAFIKKQHQAFAKMQKGEPT